MKKRSNRRQALMSLTCGVSILCVSSFGLAVVTQAQEEVEVIEEEEVTIEETPSEQDEALNAVAQMTEGQRTYYKDNGEFLERVDQMQQDFGITLPPDYDYAIRTTDEAAYNYVIPTDDSLKAYVGATFLAPDGSGELTTIICENQDTGLERPADPQLVRDPLNPTQISLQCGDYSVEVRASKVTE
jgi:hypothetical protein